MPALNQAIMLPGLVVITALFWAWIPVWALFRCMRRAKGPISDEEKLKTGLTIPYKSSDPPKDADYLLSHVSQPKVAASGPLETERPHSPKAAQMQRNEKEYGIKTEEARTQKHEEERTAALQKQKGTARDERRERRERREKEAEARRNEKGKGRASPASGESSMTISDVITAPETVVMRDSSRHKFSRR